MRSILCLTFVVVAGCGPRDGLSDFERARLAKESVAQDLQSAAKMTKKTYPQGEAWAIDLAGQQVSDEMFEKMKKVGHITELNLSKTNVNDAQCATINDVMIGCFLLKLDLSHTGVTDTGLEKLDNLLILQDLNLSGTKVTPAAVERFKQKRLYDAKIRSKSPTVKLK